MSSQRGAWFGICIEQAKKNDIYVQFTLDSLIKMVDIKVRGDYH